MISHPFSSRVRCQAIAAKLRGERHAQPALGHPAVHLDAAHAPFQQLHWLATSAGSPEHAVWPRHSVAREPVRSDQVPTLPGAEMRWKNLQSASISRSSRLLYITAIDLKRIQSVGLLNLINQLSELIIKSFSASPKFESNCLEGKGHKRTTGFSGCLQVRWCA